MIYQLTSKDEKRVALRFSEFETIDTLLNLKGKAQWAWVDCFTFLPITVELHQQLKEAGFRWTLVSPELQGRADEIETYAQQLRGQNLIPDAICTKLPNIEIWKRCFDEKAD